MKERPSGKAILVVMFPYFSGWTQWREFSLAPLKEMDWQVVYHTVIQKSWFLLSFASVKDLRILHFQMIDGKKEWRIACRKFLCTSLLLTFHWGELSLKAMPSLQRRLGNVVQPSIRKKKVIKKERKDNERNFIHLVHMLIKKTLSKLKYISKTIGENSYRLHGTSILTFFKIFKSWFVWSWHA